MDDSKRDPERVGVSGVVLRLTTLYLILSVPGGRVYARRDLSVPSTPLLHGRKIPLLCRECAELHGFKGRWGGIFAIVDAFDEVRLFCQLLGTTASNKEFEPLDYPVVANALGITSDNLLALSSTLK